jgi:hypothetical protein
MVARRHVVAAINRSASWPARSGSSANTLIIVWSTCGVLMVIVPPA